MRKVESQPFSKTNKRKFHCMPSLNWKMYSLNQWLGSKAVLLSLQEMQPVICNFPIFLFLWQPKNVTALFLGVPRPLATGFQGVFWAGVRRRIMRKVHSTGRNSCAHQNTLDPIIWILLTVNNEQFCFLEWLLFVFALWSYYPSCFPGILFSLFPLCFVGFNR